MTQSDASHFCFFDDDDILLAAGLQTHLDTLSANPEADYTYSPNLIYDDARQTSIWDPGRVASGKALLERITK